MPGTHRFIAPSRAARCRSTRWGGISVYCVARDTALLRGVGRQVGHSAGCLRNWCRAANIQARSFRDFVRALRAVYRLEFERSATDTNVLEIIDNRTLTKFRTKSGGTSHRFPFTVRDFLARQHFVNDADFVDAVRRAI